MPAAPATVTADGDAPADGAAPVEGAAPRRGEKVVDLRGGVCAPAVPLGLVRFDGPGDTRLTARVRAQGEAKLLSIVSGSGRIGENIVRPKNVSGELTWRKGAITGSVTINLPEHVKVSRTWAQEVSVAAQPQGCDWAATVVLQARGAGATLDLRGPLTESGSYVLRGSGSVSISRTKVPVTGFLRATAPGRSASTTWRVEGSTPRLVRIPGARLSGVKVALGNVVPIVRGTASLRLDAPLLTAPAVLEVAGADTWSAQVNGSNRRLWVVPQTDQVVVRTGELKGAVGMRAGRPHWTLTAPGAARIGTLDYNVDVGFEGRLTYTVQARGAVGTFLGMPEQRPFLGVPTKLTITPEGITGALTVVTRGELLLAMPGMWRGTTDYILRPVPGEGWSFKPFISHALRAGKGTMRLTGPVSETGGVDLIGSGTLEVSGTTVPTRGFYKRSSFTDGSAPVWAMAAYLDEAPDGRIPLDGGAGFVGGILVFNGTGAQPISSIPDAAPSAEAPQSRSYDITVPPVTGSGTTTLQLSDADGDTFYLPISYNYTDPSNWTATAAGTTPSNLYNPFTGLEIPETDFSGTITEAGGVQTWDLDISMQDWQDMAKGIQFKGSFTVSNSCPLADPSNCPDAEGIFVGGDSTLDFDDPEFPTAAGNGAFLTDLSWGWWDATAQGSVSVNGITMSNPAMTIWRGSGTGPNPEIVMPDLSDLNGNGMNVEFCADFTVPVPYVTTVNTLGCAEWTDQGSILAQVNTGGSMATGDYNGVTVNSTTLTGYVWNGLGREEKVFLDGVEIDAEPDRSYLTADIVVPGNAMHDFGTGSSADTVIAASGWFDGEGNFDIEGTIPVNLKGGGFTLEEILITISREKEDAQSTFDLRFDAESDVVISGNHFPLDVYIGYQKAGDTTITVGLSATGAQSTQPDGTMDFVNLVPSGDFEPENASIVDGSFDGKLPANVLDDGGFERSTDPGNLVVNGSFDDSMGQNVLPNGDFEAGTYGNILANGDFEDQNILINGDFEENGGSIVGWTTTSSAFTTSVLSGTASSSSGPADQGDYVVVLNNNSASNNATGGLTQTVSNPLGGSQVTVTAWVMSNKSSNAPFHLQLSSNLGKSGNCGDGVNIKGATVTAVPGAWTQASVTGTIADGCWAVEVTLVPESSGTSVQVDAVEMSIPSVGQANSLSSVTRPGVIAPFESMATTPMTPGYSSGLSIATDHPNTLKSNGYQAWMLYSNTSGYTSGDFDVSYKVMFPSGSNSRDIANFGFWLDGNYNTMNGYCFRLQTVNGDGGFFKCSKTSKTPISNSVGPAQFDDWYQVRLTAVSGTVTANVVNLADNTVVFEDSVFIQGGGSGVFGQVPDGAGSSEGSRWDDITFNSLQGEPGWESLVYSPTQVWFGGGAHSGVGRASLYTTSWGNAPFEYSTGETPTAGQYYTYSTWLRAASGTVNGSISLSALGGTTETVTRNFSVGTTWTAVQVTLEVTQSGHTDLRPRITIGTVNAELQVDDQVLQQLPWRPYNANSGALVEMVTDAAAHTGSNSMAVMDLVQGATVLYQFPTPGAAGQSVTFSAWVMAPSGVSGELRITEQAGSSTTPFSANGAWQQVTVTRTLQGGSDNLYVAVDVNSGQVGEMLYVDDAVVTGSQINSTQGGIGTPPSPGGWTSIVDVLPTSNVQVAPTSTKPSPDCNPATVTPGVPGNVKASYSNFSVTVTWSPSSTSCNVPIMSYWVWTTSWDLVCEAGGTAGSCTFPMPAGSYRFFVQAFATNSNMSSPSAPSNAVEVYESIAPVVLSDSAVAHSGEGTLLLQPGQFGTQVDTYSVTPAAAPAVGSTWQASVWFAATTDNNGQPVTVTFSAGGNTKSTSVKLPSAKGTWTNAVVTLPIASSATSFSIALSYTDVAGTNTVLVDDMSITEVNLTPADPWQTYAPGGFVAVQGVVDPANAQSGDGYLLLDNTGTQDAGVYLDGAYKPKSGTAHEMSFWVKSPTGQVNGVTAWLRTQDSSGNTLDSYAVGIPVTGTWQQVFISLPIKNTAAVNMVTEFDLPAGAIIWLDNVESRDVNYWSAVQPSSGVASIAIIDNAPDAANGQNYLRFSTSGANGGMGDTITTDTSGNPIDVIAGSSYKLEAYVRSTTGATVSGTMSLATSNGSTTADKTSVPFTVGGDWTPVQLTLDTTKNANTMIPTITASGAWDTLDVDELTLTPVLIEQTDPWSAMGSGVTWGVYDDPSNAYDSSYGVMEFSTATSGSGVKYVVTESTSVGEQLSATAFVRTAGASVSGTFQVTSTGGTQESWKQSFTADGDWQMVSIPITVAQSGHTGLTVSVTLDTTGTTLYLDQVAVQTNPWTPSSGAKQAIVFDGASAQSGSGYLTLESGNGQNASTYLDMAASSDIGGTYAAGTTWIATVYLRSSSPTTLATGRLSLGPADGTATSQEFSVGSEWTAVPVSYTVGSTGLSSLRVEATVDGSSVPLDIDSVSISDGTPPPDGITTPLPHPQSGWVYLWDEAFGVPGLHLWAISAQVDFEDGEPGLGISATTYQDPAKMSNVMSGTDWIKGDMAVNISETDPCFLFDFSSDGGNSGVSLGQGVFTASDYSINFAPRGCQVGPYTLPKGASLSFDGELGDGTVNFDIAITEGDDGPEFTEDIGITDITIGGFDFKEMELSILLTETDDSITFVGDMVTPMGNFNSSYDLDANEDGLVMDGSVSLTDWEWAGGGFDVEELDYDMSMTVPFGAGECGSFSSDTDGQMDMAKKTSLSFTGKIAMNCGKLEVLQMDYDYHHGSVTEVFELDYDASTGILAGEVEFDFERSTSWKFLTHRYNRHPKFEITLAYSMDVDKPSTASATLTGDVSVSGGDGSLSCTIEAGSGTNWADDQCSLHVHLSVGGGHTYNASW